MGITKSINSKANIKQYSNADYPISPLHPVIARYNVDSSALQTVINLPWTVDTINAQDSFFINVDGKVLTLGPTSDYIMTAIDSFGFSSQVTLTSSISAGLNIQAWKLGLKRESEFAQDARFVNVYESLDESLQGFVSTSSKMSATNVVGAPAAGQFYSTIQNRASMPDLRTDLKARMGIERVMTQSIYQLQDEFGPNGEPVWATPNDARVRFVGGWTSQSNINGQTVQGSAGSDYMEITFYGTGLNFLNGFLDGVDRGFSVTVDGALSSSVTITGSGIITGRNYSMNNCVNVISGLSLGVHTVKMVSTQIAGMIVNGFEILNESSSVKINPGVSYIGGKKLTSSIQNVLAYNAIATGAKGGRVLTYQKADGSIGQSWTPVDPSQLNLTSTNHANEEIIRTYHWREFGAGQSYDFSTLTSTSDSRAFTLDDGTTTLVSNMVRAYSDGTMQTTTDTSSFITLTFVGTGLDIIRQDSGNGGADSYTVLVDGVNMGSLSQGSTSIRKETIVSGLPYGTHTVRITQISAVTFLVGIHQFIVYSPKKPILPSGAIELSDYNVMADYVSTSTPGLETISTGVLRKVLSKREAVFVGSSWQIYPATIGGSQRISGQAVLSSTVGEYIEYTFFGTGLDYRGLVYSTTGSNIPVSLQNLSAGGSLLSATLTNFPTMVNSVFGTGVAFNNSTGVLDFQDASVQDGCGFTISNLPLNLWKVRFTNNTGNYIEPDCFDIITPIHSPKSNLYGDFQNTLPVGSNAISDNRKTSAIKESLPINKAWALAQGFGLPTTTSTVAIPVPDMSVTLKTNGGDLRVSYSIPAVGTVDVIMFIAIDGVIQAIYKYAGTGWSTISSTERFPASPGVHKVEIYCKVTGGTTTFYYRTLLVEEI